MIDIVVSFKPQRIHTTPWIELYKETPTTWQCNITQTNCDTFIPFECFPPKDVEDRFLTYKCEAYGVLKHKAYHTINSSYLYKDLAEAVDAVKKFLQDLKQFIILWAERHDAAKLHSIIEIKNKEVSFAEGKDLVVL